MADILAGKRDRRIFADRSMKSNHWTTLYGTRSPEFIAGVKAGVEMFAVWKSGRQVVGIAETPIEDIFREIDEGLSDE